MSSVKKCLKSGTEKNANPEKCNTVDVNSILMKTNSCLILVEPLLICNTLCTFYLGISKKAEKSIFQAGFKEYESASFTK